MKLSMTLEPQAYYDVVIQPAFSDIAATDSMYPNTLHLFEVVDNVSLANGRTMVDIFKKQNLLKRKDRSCKTIWSKVGTTGTRKLTVTELYSATEFCQEEFYDGALKDLRDNPELFRNMVFDLLIEGTQSDMLCNSYFGDTTRPDDVNEEWSWNKYDGIVVSIAQYIDDGVIKAGQVISALPSGVITPTQAYDMLEEAYTSRTDIMRTMLETDLMFTVDQDIAEAYEAYLIATGVNTAVGVPLLMNGVPSLKYKRIPIYVEKTWNPILRALNGGIDAHMCILTINGNFLFGTDKKYGGGANLDKAVRFWYSEDDDVWKMKTAMVGGTGMRSPQHTVFGITNIG